MDIGLEHTITRTVDSSMTAARMGSGLLEVLATPIMIAGMEQVCLECCAPYLPEGCSTVGISVNVRHLAPTPVGAEVRYHCRLAEIDGKRLVFTVQASDPVSIIGEGEHQRFIVDSQRFFEKSLARNAK